METTEHAAETTVAGMDEHGWSNSEPAEHAPADVAPEVAPLAPNDPGWSNGQTVTESASPVTEPSKTTARKTAPKKG